MPLVLYSQVAWDDVWQRPHELARGLAAHRPVLFCSPVQLHQVAGPQRGRWRLRRREGALDILAPLLLTGEYRAALVRALNRRLLAAALRRAIPPGRDFLFLTNSPFVDYLPAVLGARATGYDIIDDFCAFEWAPPDGRRREDRLIRSCSFAFAGTHALLEKFGPRLPGMEYLASGVDFEKITRPAPEPESLRTLPRPRLLYVGTLSDRLDGMLLDAVARSFPDASVILVGPRRATFRAPSFPANVRELGLQPHDALPGFYQHCDLGLMPFADNDAARAINPVKTLEYLAAGMPVISTPIPDVERFYRDVVTIKRPDAWPGAIKAMLANPAAAAPRVEFARDRSWKNLVAVVEGRLRDVEVQLSAASRPGRMGVSRP